MNIINVFVNLGGMQIFLLKLIKNVMKLTKKDINKDLINVWKYICR